MSVNEKEPVLRHKLQNEIIKMFPETKRTQAESLLSNLFITMLENLQTKENIYIREIGNIHFKLKGERKFVLNGKSFTKKASIKVHFTPSKQMKDYIGLVD